MDDHNVHHFWGLSPALDLLDLLQAAPAHRAGEGSINLLQARALRCRAVARSESAARALRPRAWRTRTLTGDL